MIETKTGHEGLKGMTYLQMRLYIEEVTPEQEKKYNKELKLNPLKPKIYEATEKDIETIVNLYNKSWLTSNTPFRRITIENAKNLYDDPNLIIFIAKCYGTPAGCIILDFEGEKDHYSCILALAVLPRFQHRGLGRILGFNAGELLKQRNIKEVRSEVYVDNIVSYKFHQAMGFKEIDVITYKNEKMS